MCPQKLCWLQVLCSCAHHRCCKVMCSSLFPHSWQDLITQLYAEYSVGKWFAGRGIEAQSRHDMTQWSSDDRKCDVIWCETLTGLYFGLYSGLREKWFTFNPRARPPPSFTSTLTAYLKLHLLCPLSDQTGRLLCCYVMLPQVIDVLPVQRVFLSWLEWSSVTLFRPPGASQRCLSKATSDCTALMAHFASEWVDRGSLWVEWKKKVEGSRREWEEVKLGSKLLGQIQKISWMSPHSWRYSLSHTGVCERCPLGLMPYKVGGSVLALTLVNVSPSPDTYWAGGQWERLAAAETQLIHSWSLTQLTPLLLILEATASAELQPTEWQNGDRIIDELHLYHTAGLWRGGEAAVSLINMEMCHD